jgi:hypothetical protein
MITNVLVIHTLTGLAEQEQAEQQPAMEEQLVQEEEPVAEQPPKDTAKAGAMAKGNEDDVPELGNG